MTRFLRFRTWFRSTYSRGGPRLKPRLRYKLNHGVVGGVYYNLYTRGGPGRAAWSARTRDPRETDPPPRSKEVGPSPRQDNSNKITRHVTSTADRAKDPVLPFTALKLEDHIFDGETSRTSTDQRAATTAVTLVTRLVASEEHTTSHVSRCLRATTASLQTVEPILTFTDIPSMPHR